MVIRIDKAVKGNIVDHKHKVEDITDLESTYLKLDTTNDPLTGDLEISKADPESRLTDTGNGSYTRITRTDTNNTATRYSQVGSLSNSYAINYTGTDSRFNLTTPISFASNEAWTIVFWARKNSGTTAFNTHIGKYASSQSTIRDYGGNSTNYANMDFIDESRTRATWAGSASGAKNALTDYVLHAFVYDGAGTINYYRDNSNRGSRSVTGNYYIDVVGFSLTTNWSSPYSYDDELAVWRRALTTDELSDIYNGGNGLYLDTDNTFASTGTSIGQNLELLAHFDEGSGSTMIDSSGNGNNGTYTGGTPTYQTGFIEAERTIVESKIWEITENANLGEYGTLTFGDTQTRIVHEGSYHSFNIANSEKFYVDTNGDLVFPDNYTRYDGTGKDVSHSFDGEDYNTTGTGDWNITGFTNVGIGTSSPQAPLHINATGNAFFRTEGTTNVGFQLYKSGTFAGSFVSNDATNTISFYSYNNASTPRLQIDTSGNIKIPADSKKLLLGEGDDSSIYYNAQDMVFNSAEVGTGAFLYQGGRVQYSGNNAPSSGAGIEMGFTTSGTMICFDRDASSYRDMIIAADELALRSGSVKKIITDSSLTTFESNPVLFNGVRAMFSGTLAGTTGAGVEIAGNSSNGVILGYDRDLSQYIPLRIIGSTLDLEIAGTDALTIDANRDIHIPADSKKLYFGAGDDASIYYDGTDLWINPQEVGTGNVMIGDGADLEITNGRIAFNDGATGNIIIQNDGGNCDIVIGSGNTYANQTVNIGSDASTYGSQGVAIGHKSNAGATSVAVGAGARVRYDTNSVAVGENSGRTYSGGGRFTIVGQNMPAGRTDAYYTGIGSLITPSDVTGTSTTNNYLTIIGQNFTDTQVRTEETLLVSNGSIQLRTGIDQVSGNSFAETDEVRINKRFLTNVTTVTSTSHTAGDEHVILVDDDTAGGIVTVTLPAASGNTGLQYHIKKIGTTANVVVDGNASETIDGGTTATLNTQYECITIVCDGSNWHII